jgi:hypothetical protein
MDINKVLLQFGMSEPTIMWTRVYVSKFKVKTLALAGEVS